MFQAADKPLYVKRIPMLPKPYADTINSSCHNSMKESRVQGKGGPIQALQERSTKYWRMKSPKLLPIHGF
ncbi:hypothetical protein B5C26_00645 [Photorhabdus luminescens]|nr:hypothetical protein B5C26_00645 [Photorhabdus luminescens]